LGLGGVTAQGPSRPMVGAESFAETSKADISMNLGVNAAIGSCVSQNLVTAAIAHEFGHTLGLRHSDRTRTNVAACTDPAYDCSGAGELMTSTVAGVTALGLWDIRAITALYPPTAAAAAPTNVLATANGTSVTVSWSMVTGAASYEVHRSAKNNATTFSLVCTTSGTSCATSTLPNEANSSYLYKVRVGSSGMFSMSDLATTVVFTDALSAGVTVKATHLNEIRTAVNAVQTLAGQTPTGYTDNTITGGTTIVKAAHINEPRTRLDAARMILGVGTMAFTDNPLTSGTPIKALHITQLRTGVQ
jgi:hypothetical protein